MSAELEALWPFRANYYEQFGWCYHMGVPERLDAVKRMTDPAQLRAAMEVSGLQTTVRRAIERRLEQVTA